MMNEFDFRGNLHSSHNLLFKVYDLIVLNLFLFIYSKVLIPELLFPNSDNHNVVALCAIFVTLLFQECFENAFLKIADSSWLTKDENTEGK